MGEELIEPINEAIKKQNQKLKVITRKTNVQRKFKGQLIESLKRMIAELDKENKKLKKDNALLLGKLAKS